MADVPPGSVTRHLPGLKAGDEQATAALVERYLPLVLSFVRARLRGAPRGTADEEDVALSAFASLCLRARREDGFDHLDDRGDLWQLLQVIAGRKAARLRRHEGQEKRGGGRVMDEAALGAEGAPGGLDQLALDPEASPEETAVVRDEVCRLLDVLGDDTLREIVALRLAGHTEGEIGQRLGRSVRTIERKLERIRTIWHEEAR